MPKNNNVSAQDTLLHFLQLQHHVLRQVDVALSVHGLGYSEYMVLHFLKSEEKGALRNLDLAEKIGLTPSGIARIVVRMEKIGLVKREKSERDARESFVILSNGGNRLFQDALLTFTSISETTFSVLDKSLLHSFSESVAQLTA